MLASIKRMMGMLLMMALLCVTGTAMAAYSGSDYTTDPTMAGKLDKLLNGEVAIFYNTSKKFPMGSYLDNKFTYLWGPDGYYGGSSCYAYGQAAYYYLNGEIVYHGNMNLANSINIQGVKLLTSVSYELFLEKGIACGAYIRTTVNKDGSYSNDGHSMIVLTYNEKNITFLHGNADGEGLVTVSTKSWKDFNYEYLTKRGRRIAYIFQPKVTANSLSYIDAIPRIASTTRSCNKHSSASTGAAVMQSFGRNTIIYIDAKYNEEWYRVEGGGYVRADDVEIKVDNATISDMTGQSCAGIVVTNDGYLKDKPYEAAAHSETVKKGKTVNIKGAVTNKHGNTWYVTDGGKYIYSGDVEKFTASELFTITGNFKVTRSCKSKQMPTSSSQNVKSFSKGDKVEVTRFVTNEYGNIWAQLKDGSYVHFCDKGSTETHLTYIDTSKMADETSLKYQKYAKSGSKYVKQDVTPGNLVVNSTTGIYISGTVKTQAPILTVVARVANGKNQVLSSPVVTVRPPISLRSFSVHTATAQRNGGSKVNITEALTFRGMDSKNAAGPYRFELAVQLGFEYGGQTYKLGSEQVVDSYGFYVGKKTSETVAPQITNTPTPKPTATPTPKPTATPTPKPTAAPVTKRLPGDVNGDGRVSYADLLRLAKYLSKWKNVSINEANANCNGDAKISYADLLRLAKYLSGWKVTLE